jgi:L-2-hydroxyglutarate oxidase LhgO
VSTAPETDVVVVGGGVIGLASAAALAVAGRSVVLVERNAAIAREVTARNSEVIHAGIYYPEGSLKAQLCVAGRRALYERCRRLRIPHRMLGKLIVATDSDELAVLESLQQRAHANGVPEVASIDEREVRRREPFVRALGALDSPVSGIVDAHALCLSYAAEAEAHGAVLVMQTEVLEIERRAPGYRVTARGGDGDRSAIGAAAVVNAAGLASDVLAERAGFDVDACGYRLHPCKGDYFSLAPGAPVGVERLVYPVPRGAALGVHAPLDLGGRIRFGPDAEYVAEIRYDVDPAKAADFAQAVRRYLPALEADWLQPDYAGIRPRLAGPGEAFRDFAIAEESEAGWPGFVNLIGIESPGLTAAPAISERVVELLAGL